MRSVAQDDPRFTVGIAAIKAIELDAYPPSSDPSGRLTGYLHRNAFLPGELVRPLSSPIEVMVLARKHLEHAGAHEWVSIARMTQLVDATAGLRYIINLARPGIAEIYNCIDYPERATSHLKVTEYVFAVLDWGPILAHDAAVRLGMNPRLPMNHWSSV